MVRLLRGQRVRGHHEHEYNAIRNASALIDVSPLFKYLVTGRDAARFVDRLITRDVSKMAVGQVFYTPWCDEHGKVIDDGTVSRLSEQTFRWTAADPSLRWFRQNAVGLDVAIEDISEDVRRARAAGADVRAAAARGEHGRHRSAEVFPRRRAARSPASASISRAPATPAISATRSGFRSRHALTVWDALMDGGKPFDIKPCGMLALDVARVEAGLLLIDVDFFGSKKAMIESQRYSPYEMGLGRLVSLDKSRFIGQRALREEQRRGPARQVVGLEIDWTEVEAIYERLGLAPAVGATASRVAVPVYSGGRQVGTGDDDDLVAGAEADDRAGDDRSAALRRRDQAAVRSDRRSRAPPCRRHGRQDAVLQSEAENRGSTMRF